MTHGYVRRAQKRQGFRGEQLYVSVAQPVESRAPYRPAVSVSECVTEDIGESPAHARSEPQPDVRPRRVSRPLEMSMGRFKASFRRLSAYRC